MKSYMVLIFLTPLAACVNYDTAILTPTISLSSEEVSLIPDRDENLRVDFGLELGLNESDSLLRRAGDGPPAQRRRVARSKGTQRCQ